MWNDFFLQFFSLMVFITTKSIFFVLNLIWFGIDIIFFFIFSVFTLFPHFNCHPSDLQLYQEQLPKLNLHLIDCLFAFAPDHTHICEHTYTCTIVNTNMIVNINMYVHTVHSNSVLKRLYLYFSPFSELQDEK